MEPISHKFIWKISFLIFETDPASPFSPDSPASMKGGEQPIPRVSAEEVSHLTQ
jgi:hypothetical protein